jgi:aminoglycoside 6'-N-acetyltransferase
MQYPLLTERLSIRPLVLADLDSFVGYRQDPSIARFQSWEPAYPEHQARELIESQAGVFIPDKGQWLQLGIHNLVSDELVGDLALHSVVEGEGIFELGFTIAKRHQGQGFAKEAAAMIITHLVAEVGATKFVANTDRRNAASIAVLLALGFRRDSSRTWEENFKNEDVIMDYFETGLVDQRSINA